MFGSCNPKVAAAVAPMVENLESRTMLSAVLSAKGTLAVTGSQGGDVIVVRQDPQHASKIVTTINGVGQKFDKIKVKRIEIYGLGGADRLTLDDSKGIISRRGATLIGAAGNDTLVGGQGAATFDGGDGNDSILGSSKNDLISGGLGNDTIIGGRGDDRIFGLEGDDLLRGSLGNDMLYGDAGNDSIFGEDGNDTLGGDGEDRIWLNGKADPVNFAGNDSLNGGNGDDWLVGGRQSATLNDNNGLDTLTGGPGNDILDSRGWKAPNPNPFDSITDREAGDIVPMENYTRQATPAELALGEDAYAVHMHAFMTVKINDNGTMRDARIQAGIGDFVSPTLANTSPVFHVHETQEGVLHMHDLDPHTFTLGEFFRGWGISIGKDHIGRYIATNGHTLTFSVKHGNGQTETLTDPYNYIIQGHENYWQGDQITITYT
jgi:Ca2+-binding RTX toxin-like protein